MLPTAGKIFLVFLMAATLFLFALRARFLISLLRLGKDEDRFDQLGTRLRHFLGQVLLQRCVLKNVTKKDRSGLGHMLIFYGFCVFAISYGFHIAEGFYEKLSPAILGSVFNNVFFLVLDTVGLIVTATLIWAATRRYIIKPFRLEPVGSIGAAIILLLIFLLMILGFSVEGFRLLAEDRPFADWAFVGMAFSEMFKIMGLETHGRSLFYIFWALHMTVIFGFGIYLLYSKHLHILAAHFNLYFHSLDSKGSLQPICDLEEAETYGASKISDFSWKQLLDLYACTECGQCNANCPATLSEKPLKPKELILDLRKHLLTHGRELLNRKEFSEEQYPCIIEEAIPKDVLWDCTNCAACMEVCPVGIEHVQKIVDMRRYLVLMESNFPSEVIPVFKGMERNSNPWGLGKATRADWSKNLGIKSFSEENNVDILYYTGCVGSFDDHGKKTSTAMVKILQSAGIRFGILGTEERCCGDSARRIGNEYLYQIMAQENMEIFHRYGVKKVLANCPHCYNTLKNEYPKLGGTFEVVHHTAFIFELIKNGKLNLQGDFAKRITYHDSCCLGRYNKIYDTPRKVLRSIPKAKLVEMDRNRRYAFCCGAGGGRMWMPRVRGKRVYAIRTEQALSKYPDVIATACPFCTIHFEDGLKFHEAEKGTKVLDIAELVAGHLTEK
jgi:Fe-S oxidoreductase